MRTRPVRLGDVADGRRELGLLGVDASGQRREPVAIHGGARERVDVAAQIDAEPIARQARDVGRFDRRDRPCGGRGRLRESSS
jgi:hypothetical protein